MVVGSIPTLGAIPRCSSIRLELRGMFCLVGDRRAREPRHKPGRCAAPAVYFSFFHNFFKDLRIEYGMDQGTVALIVYGLFRDLKE